MAKYTSDKEAADALFKAYQDLKTEIGKVIVGQDEVIKLVLTSMFCKGHSLLVGVPGLAKTLLINTISEALNMMSFRIKYR